MSSFGELIQALGALKNVKEKRHGIKTLSSLCANRAFQVRIVNKGGWQNAILPLIISLDEECRKYASLAIANLSTSTSTHEKLLEEQVLRHLVPILQSEEVTEVVVYVLNALGNFACSPIMWQQLRLMNTMETVVNILKSATREEIKVNALFFLANLSADEETRQHMIEISLHETVWEHMRHPNYLVMQYALAMLRGLSVEAPIQDTLPRLGIMPLLVGVFKSQSPQVLKVMVLDIILHLSFLHSNSMLLLDRTVVECVVQAARSSSSPEFVTTAVAIIANLCENVELHDRLMETDLFTALSEHVEHDSYSIQQHVIRGLMQLSLSPKYHHVILATNVVAKVCMIALADLPEDMRVNALELMAAVCATHPTVPTDSDVVDLLYLICTESIHIDIRRAAMLALANASSDARNSTNLLKRPYVEALLITMSKSADVMLVDYMTQFFHNICKMDQKAGSMLIQCGYGHHMFTFERLEALSITAAVYVCDTCRHLVEDAVIRAHLLERMMFQTMLDAWAVYIEEPHIAPHLALMCSAFAFHADTHREFVMQHGVRLVIELYSRSEVEHVRLCCLLTLLYLADGPFAQRAISQERGLQMLLNACESETHIDLITNSLKALIPFASSDDYRPQLGMDGGIDTFASFLFSPHLPLQQLGVYLLQNLLELGLNRRIFLNIAEERKTEEDYLDPLVRFLPQIKKGRGTTKKQKTSPKARGKKGKNADKELTAHDPFVVRCTIHSIALLCLENHDEVRSRFIELQIPQTLYTLLYSECIDRSSGEAIMLFFANLLHSSKYVQAGLLRQLEIVPMLLSSAEMGFSKHTDIRCLSALLSISRTPEFKQRVLGQLELIMTSVNLNISVTERDESFYSTASLHCILLSELAMSAPEVHEKMRNAGVMEAFLIFITIAGRGLRDEICVELLMGAVFGVATLTASPTCGEAFINSLLFPATRLQLFVSLLRLPADDINTTFHLGTVGLRTLQRTIAPGLRAEELHIDNLDTLEFYDMCGIKPSDFIYRNVVRTLCVILARGELARTVIDSISMQNVVPTCLFALRGTSDIFVQVLGYMLVGRFTIEPKLQNAFVNDSSVINEILTVCRRYSPDSETAARGPKESEAFKLAAFGKAAGQWSVQSVNRNRYLLAMVTLTNLAERVKEKYRNQEIKAGTPEQEGQLSYSNHSYLSKMTASCLQQMDAEELLESNRIDEIPEFTAMLRVVVVHNSFMARIEIDQQTKGGLVKLADPPQEYPRAVRAGQELVLPELRAEFKSLFQVQAKAEGLLHVTQKCLELETGHSLVGASIEVLCALTYLGPMSIRDPSLGYRLLQNCPTWIQPSLCCLFANTLSDGARPSGDLDYLTEEESSHLYPLAATAPPETMRFIRGALANVAARNELFDFVVSSGVLRVYRHIETRGHFCEEFAIIIESTRILANLTSRPKTHKEVCTEHVMAFLRDVLHHCATLLKGDLGNARAMPPDEELINATFTEDDAPPLGIRLRWEQPAKIIEIIPDLPAAFLEETLEKDDQLIEVNGVDVQEMIQEEITPMFEVRPLNLVFRRLVKPDVADSEEEVEEVIQQVHEVSEYGDRDQYLECFHLAILTLHNLAAVKTNHEKMLAEPKVLSTLLELIPSSVLLPSLRRLVFSLLTCLCQQKAISGRIFTAMSEYFMEQEAADISLQKYIVLSANLYYTSIDQVVPDRTTLLFIGKLASSEGMAGANQALVEILHRMSMGPKELRAPFVCHETMVLTVQFVDLIDYQEVQLQAFEVAYFLTISNLVYNLWASTDLIPRMVKSAAASEHKARLQGDEKSKQFEDALWELTLRTLSMCLGNNILLKQMILSELDRYLMKLFLGGDQYSIQLLHCAGHLMAGMLQTGLAGTFWNRWKSMGVADKFIAWFGSCKEALKVNRSSQEVGQSVDSVLHLLLFALDTDPSFLVTLGAGDVVSCITLRILNQIVFYQNNFSSEDAAEDSELIVPTNSAYRANAQLVSLLTSNENALDIMNRMELSSPLVSLLKLRAEDFREPTLVILASLCAHHSTCNGLMHSTDFRGILTKLEENMEDPKFALPHEELEYLVCILDRSCCRSSTASSVQHYYFHLLCLLMLKTESMDSQVLTLRAIAQCSFERAECLDALSTKDMESLHYIMAVNQCLHFEMRTEEDSEGEGDDEDEGGMAAVARRNMLAKIAERNTNYPIEARLVRHFARTILCEGISISRSVCQAVFVELDILSLLGDLTAVFNNAYTRIDDHDERVDVVTSDLMNGLNSTLHIVLSAVFRGGSHVLDDNEPNPKTLQAQHGTTDALVNVLDAIHGWLRMEERQYRSDNSASVIASKLTEDLRVLFLVSALLREVCAKPARSVLLRVVRSRKFSEVLEATIRLSLNIFKRSLNFPDAGRPREERNSPFAKHMIGIRLPFIFEHLIVCMRHMLAQAMFIPTPVVDLAPGGDAGPSEPWCWVSQDQLEIHKGSVEWIPDVLKRYREEPGITMEVVRYVSAVATFYTAPQASVDESEPKRPLCDLYGLFGVRILQMLTAILETDEDANTVCLATLAVANLAECERERRVMTGSKAKLPVADLLGLVNALIRVMGCVPGFPREMALICTIHALRAPINFFAFEDISFAFNMLTSGYMQAVKDIFKEWFRDVFKIHSVNDYTLIAQLIIQFVRNWTTVGHMVAHHFEEDRRSKGVHVTKLEKKRGEEIDEQLKTIDLLNFLVSAVFKLADTPREVPNKTKVLDGVFEEAIATMQTLFFRQSRVGSMDWEQVQQEDLERLLQCMLEHRRAQSGVFEDAPMIQILFMMTKLGVRFARVLFPDYLMHVAYGPREHHSEMQDIAAVCCAIISTQRKGQGDSAASCNIADVVENCADFIRSLSEVPDRRMRLWHFRTITLWSMRPKVLDEVSENEFALRYLASLLADDLMGRYAVIFLHNVSVLRCRSLLKAAGLVAVICDAYRKYCKGGGFVAPTPEVEGQRRMLQHLLLAMVRNSFLGSSDLQTELADADLTAIVALADCVHTTDIGFYLATLLYCCHELPPERVAAFIPTHAPLVDLLVQLVFEKENTPQGGYSGFEDLYNMVIDPTKPPSEQEKDEEENGTASPPTSPTQRQASPTRRDSPSRRDASPTTRGLGKKASLYLQRRREKPGATKSALNNQPPPTESKKKKGEERKYKDQCAEYVYFAAAEILTHSTFRKDDPLKTEPAEGPDATREAISAAFAKHSVTAYLRFLENQAQLHDGKKIVLEPLFVHVSAKFLLHCWSNTWFVHHFDTPVNIKLVSELIPFFLSWRVEDVHPLLAEVCLRARLHQYPSVCQYLAIREMKFPELACTVLSHSLVDTACHLSTRQAFDFLKVFTDLLRRRCISRNGLRRLAVSVEMALLIDHPAGLASQFMQKQFRLLGDLLEQLGTYIESGTVKQSMVVITALTVGGFYKPLQDLDGFVLRMLDMAGPLLEDEFVLFMPVLYRLASVGGKRVQAPILSKHLHMRVARILEDDVAQLEAGLRAKERITADDGPQLNLCQRIQWMLIFFSTLGAAPPSADGNAATGAGDNLHFDAFVCVDLLPVLVRILKAAPKNVEALCAGFLLSSVAGSPCIVPHMPAILQCAERAFPQLVESTAITDPAAKLALVDEPKWPHLHLSIEVRITMAMRRNLVNLLANASYQPALKPPLLGEVKPVYDFFTSLDCERYTFDNPTIPLYVKLFVTAQMCSCSDRDVQNSLLDHGILDALGEAEQQLKGEFIPEGKNHPCDMRLLWVHAVVSLTMFSGSKLLKIPSGVARILSAMNMAEALQRENAGFRALGLGLVLECQQAIASALGKLSNSQDFTGVRENYTLYLLGIICSASVCSLRLAACEHLIDMLSKGYRADICGAVLLRTNCIESFKSIICGPVDDLASGVTRVMIAFVQNCTYDVYCTLLENLAAIEAMVGDPNAHPLRILWLAELFSALTKERTLEVYDAVLEIPSIVSFLSLARAQQARKRELVQHWLENLGSSLYEVDEVIAAFQTSTYHGYLLIASRCTLDPKDAKEFRRILFGAVYKRVQKWRDTVFGIGEFFSASLMKAMLPMCDLQPDLVAAMISLFHSFMTHGEHQMVERLWDGGHFLWICKRLTHKSQAQKEIMLAAPNAPPAVARMKGTWPSHGDLVVTQGMVTRLLWEFFEAFPVDLCERTVTNGGSVKTWLDYVTYYIHFSWPEDSRDVEQATESVVLLAMRFFESVQKSVDENMQQSLIQQGLLQLGLTVLLPSPEVQQSMQTELQDAAAIPDASDSLHLPDAKMMAGAMVARMTHFTETYQCVMERRYTPQSVSMFAQLYNWASILFDEEKQGRAKVISTVGLVERISTLYLNLLSVTHLDWLLPQLGLGKLEALVGLMLDFWCRHPNVVMQHYALRQIGTFFQVHALYAAAMAIDERALAVKNAVHRMFGIWDVRELRQVLRLMCAALGHAVDVPVLPNHVSAAVTKAMTLESAHRLRTLMQEGGAVRANHGAAANLLTISYFSQVFERSEHPGDVYCRVWSLWLTLAMLAHSKESEGGAAIESDNPDKVLVFYAEAADKEKLARRAKMLAEQEAVAVKKSDSVTGPSVAFGKENLPPTCRIEWLKKSKQLNISLARMAGKSIAYLWRESETIGLVAAAQLLIEFPLFLDTAAFAIDGNAVLHCITQPEKSVQLNSLLLIAILSAFKLPLQAQTLHGDFLKHWYDLQEVVIEGIVGGGEGPYDMLASWLRRGLYSSGSAVEADFRCLIAFIIGQGLCPPLATVPSLNVDTAERPERAPGGRGGKGDDEDEIPTVAECPPPPEALLGRLSQDILEEDLRLKNAQVPPPRSEGPLFSTMLCHLLYALAAMVPLHAKAAAFSSKVRGAAFSQLMKVQSIMASNIRTSQLLDKADGDRDKLYLYIRATACIRAALQSIMGSWFAADFGASFSISEEGGQDFVQYCTKHIIQVYNNKIALTKVLGSPWQRVMLTQGPTSTIAELLMVLCSSDANLKEVGRLGGQQALHSLSKYGETVQTRQQATMLLTKLAVLDAPAGR